MTEWTVTPGLTDYLEAMAVMEKRVADMHAGQAEELVWLVEHPPLYTAGTSSRPDDLTDPDRFPVYQVGRGGQYTYHGPGQRVVYVMLDLNRRGRDVRAFVNALQNWVIAALAQFDLDGQVRRDRPGIWIERPSNGALMTGQIAEDKIAAIGIRLRNWISFHGIAINVDPDLTNYSGIVPCGIVGHGVTSLADLGKTATMLDLDDALRSCFSQYFPDL